MGKGALNFKSARCGTGVRPREPARGTWGVEAGALET